MADFKNKMSWTPLDYFFFICLFKRILIQRSTFLQFLLRLFWKLSKLMISAVLTHLTRFSSSHMMVWLDKLVLRFWVPGPKLSLRLLAFKLLPSLICQDIYIDATAMIIFLSITGLISWVNNKKREWYGKQFIEVLKHLIESYCKKM